MFVHCQAVYVIKLMTLCATISTATTLTEVAAPWEASSIPRLGIDPAPAVLKG
jgi:hypothetical protein